MLGLVTLPHGFTLCEQRDHESNRQQHDDAANNADRNGALLCRALLVALLDLATAQFEQVRKQRVPATMSGL